MRELLRELDRIGNDKRDLAAAIGKNCSWCNTDPHEAEKLHEGPHAIWCPLYDGFGGRRAF